MRRTRSMENLEMLPEEAKMAASLLRLTLSDKQESSCPDSGFQSYMRTNNQFPYHRSILIVDVKRPEATAPITINSSAVVNYPTGVNMEGNSPQKRRILRRRCESSPSAISSDDSKTLDKLSESSSLSKSAPTEGFFHRLFPSFLRRRFSKELPEQVEKAPTVVTAAANKRGQAFPKKVVCQEDKETTGQFVREFVRMESKMDNLIFMSMR